MSLFHGLQETRKTPFGKSVYVKRVKYCAAHGWIDLFIVGGVIGWEKYHGKCGVIETSPEIYLKPSLKKAA